VTLKQIALACDISIDYAAKLAASHTDPTQSRQLSYTHLMLLAQHIETREFARALMAPLLGIVDVQQLRVADLERMGQDYGSAAMETLERIKARLGLIPGAAVVMAPGLEMQVAANLNGEK
jgi:mRNA-degrading endonuclease toxin of MazEF toxin-antitoxin module